MREAGLYGATVLALLMLSSTECLCIDPAPYDADTQCGGNNYIFSDNNTLVLLDSHSYLTLGSLWFADDESIDLFSFPVPEDPQRWSLVDARECGNVWQYCGNSTSDILITQFISRGNISGTELTISIDFKFFDLSQPAIGLSCSEEEGEVLIVEADDTTGARNVHIQHIECGDPRIRDVSEDTSRYDFTYIPLEDFEMVFRANISENVCINISRVRVFHHFCPSIVDNFVQYNFTSAGREVNGTCVSNTVPLPETETLFQASCEENGTWTFNPVRGSCQCASGYTLNGTECVACPVGTYKAMVGGGLCLECPNNSNTTTEGSTFCTCITGYQREDPVDVSLPCDECAPSDYRDSRGLCVPCPTPGASNEGAYLDRCRCANGSLGELSSGGGGSVAACEVCAANYYRSLHNSSCVLCPPGSRRELGSTQEDVCVCVNGSSTASGGVQTTFDPCNRCDTTHYSDGLQCIRCPGNSFSESPTDRQCTCANDTVNPTNGSLTTTVQDCVCVSGLYRHDDDGLCIPCPANSHRNYNDTTERVCPCNNGYLRRSPTDPTLPCLPVVGFNQSSIILLEGDDSSHAVTLSVFISAAVSPRPPLSVSLSLSPPSLLYTLMTDLLTFTDDDLRKDFQLRLPGDMVALEDTESFIIVLMEGDGDYIIGGSPSGTQQQLQHYYGNLDIEVEDDDIVFVGFEEREVRTGGSLESVRVTVVISTDIVREMVIRVTPSELSVRVTTDNELTFQPSGPRLQSISLDLRDTLDSDSIVLTLELADQSTPLPELEDRVQFGGGGAFSELTLVVRGDEPLSDGARVGVAVGSSVAALLILAVAIVAMVTLLLYYRHGNKKSRDHHHRSATSNEYDELPMKAIEAEHSNRTTSKDL